MCTLASRVLFREENGYSSVPSLPSPGDRLKKGLNEALSRCGCPHGQSPSHLEVPAGPLVLRASGHGSQYFKLWESAALGGFSTLQGNSHPGLCSISPTPTTQPCADAGLYQDGLPWVLAVGKQVVPFPKCLLSKQKHTGHKQAGAERASLSFPLPSNTAGHGGVCLWHTRHL